MNHSEVYVQYSDGSKPRGKKVYLCFSGLTGGQTKPAFTDVAGVALIEHATVGTATVYVDGRSRGTFRTPGRKVVIL